MDGSLPAFIAKANLAQWAIAIFTGGTFAAAFRFVILWRGQTLANEEAVAKRISTSEQQIRDHYADAVETLRDRLDGKDQHFTALEKHWREMLAASDKRHEECEEARVQLRKELNALHEEIRGLYVQIRRASTDAVLLMERGGKPSESAPHAVKAARRLEDREGGDRE